MRAMQMRVMQMLLSMRAIQMLPCLSAIQMLRCLPFRYCPRTIYSPSSRHFRVSLPPAHRLQNTKSSLFSPSTVVSPSSRRSCRHALAPLSLTCRLHMQHHSGYKHTRTYAGKSVVQRRERRKRRKGRRSSTRSGSSPRICPHQSQSGPATLPLPPALSLPPSPPLFPPAPPSPICQHKVAIYGKSGGAVE